MLTCTMPLHEGCVHQAVLQLVGHPPTRRYSLTILPPIACIRTCTRLRHLASAASLLC